MYRVVFVGSIKELTPEYKKYNDDLYASAQTLDGFIGIDSEVIEGIEITISKWKTKGDVMKWAMDPLHMEAKKQVLPKQATDVLTEESELNEISRYHEQITVLKEYFDA